MAWNLAEPFDIDNGELNGLTRQEIFAMGVEFEMFRQKLATGEAFRDTVLTVNVDRLKAMCERHGRPCTSGWVHDDHAGYRWIDVRS